MIWKIEIYFGDRSGAHLIRNVLGINDHFKPCPLTTCMILVYHTKEGVETVQGLRGVATQD